MLNRAEIIGNLGQDPEVRNFSNGGRVANLSVATTRKWKDRQSGETQERTEWHRVSIKADGLVGVVQSYLKKGSKVFIEGRLETRKWQDQSGQDRYTTEIVVGAFEGKLVMLGDPRGGGASGGGYDSGSPSGQTGVQSTPDLDDEIPF
ncbi:MAG: single-stranded DNA-binding protein [Pseudomonadota bacterium]